MLLRKQVRLVPVRPDFVRFHNFATLLCARFLYFSIQSALHINMKTTVCEKSTERNYP